jgi:hypothetical protein
MRRAFTILELLAATALTALLMVAVLHVVGTLGASRAALVRQADAGAWRSDLLDTLRRDLTNAAQVTFAKDGVTLTGHGALDPVTLEFGHEPVTVVYRLATIHDRRWLVRRQAPRDGLSTQAAWAELLCPDVIGFTIRPAGGLGIVPIDPAQGGAKAAMPAVVTVVLEGANGQVMNETLVLR